MGKPAKKLQGQIFGELTVLCRTANPQTRKNDTATYWLCQCTCGKQCVIRGYSLTIGKTRSCGCLVTQQQKYPEVPDRYLDGYRYWKKQNSKYKDITFEHFYQTITQKCHYCGLPPQYYSKGFNYSSLDRLDSQLGYQDHNIVASCLTCNRAKLNRSVSDFEQYLTQLTLSNGTPEEYRLVTTSTKLSNLTNSYILTTVRGTKWAYRDGYLTDEQFYQLTSSPCYYCNSSPKQKRNLSNNKNGVYYYNGLDRVDNNLDHRYTNVIPCCKYCNSAKNNLSLSEFQNWITRVIIR